MTPDLIVLFGTSPFSFDSSLELEGIALFSKIVLHFNLYRVSMKTDSWHIYTIWS